MTLDLNVPATLAVAFLSVTIYGAWRDRPVIFIPAALLFFACTMTYCETTPEKQAERKAKAEAERQARIPHVIREADGCKVYAFVAGSKEHYFTRCADAVTTDRNYEVKKSCGKNCTKTEQHTETIITKVAP